MSGEIVKHSVSISGHRTSISLEKEFWDLFCKIAQDRGLSINELIAEIDEKRNGNLSSAVRLCVLHDLLNRP
ncbi:MAG: ribbon-helix-helix domain-containing protein [Sneathiella sp.]|nr:ribbon-helix-helix domain-containing protein [Sneathiella sp.]